MKLRNVLIVLFAVLIVFAFASCKNEPKVDPKPTPGPTPTPGPVDGIYQIQITEGVDKDYWNRDKLKLFFEEEVKAGDTITLKYRSERDVYQWDIRNETDKIKWVYETHKGYGDDPTTYFVDPVEGEDGWFTLTYTFADTVLSKVTGTEIPAEFESSDGFGIYFRGNYVSTDIFEIKDITLNGEAIALDEDCIISKAVLTGDEDYPRVNHDWTVKNYSVLFASGQVGEVDKTPLAEKVVSGGFVTGAPVAKEGYTLTIYTTADKNPENIFDPTIPITEEKIFYYSYVGVPRTVTFVTNGGSEIADTEVENGKTLTAPEAPTKEGVAFAEWCTDEGLTTPYNFAAEVLGDLTLYAKYGTPVAVTFDAQNGDEPIVKQVAEGYPIAAPATPENGTKMFLGWYTDEECADETIYSFATPVTEPITLYAGWVNSTDVTLKEGETTLKTFKAALDVALAEDDENLAVEDDRIGYVFAGWYADAELTEAYDFETVVTAPFTLYAKWEEATLYRLVSTHNNSEDMYTYDKFTIQYKGEGMPVANEGDVLSFRYRTTTPFTFFNVRGDNKWVYEASSAPYGMTTYETKEDGWTYVTYTFSAKYSDGTDAPANAWWRFDFGTRTVVVGDILEIQDWTFKGEPLAIEAANVTQYLAPTLSIVEGGSYEWGKRTVTFDVGEATPIDPVEVDFDRAVELPADPALEGKAFAGWFTDAEFEHAFDAKTFITEDITLYAKFADAVTVTFNGTELANVVMAKGNKLAQPADPEKAENVFGGWYSDPEFNAEFDFSVAIEADTTIYAKWIPSWTVTLNYNYGDTPETKAIYVGKGEVMAAPANIARVGYFFGGWCDDAEGTVAHDWTAAVTANTTVYAKWTAPTKAYQFTSTVAESRWQFRWHEDTVEMFNGKINAGDVFTLMLKFPEGNELAENYWRLRTRSGEKHITENTSFSSTTKEGDWYLITVTVPDTIENGSGLYLQVYGASEANWPVGSVMIIKAFAYNGQEIEIDARDYGTASTRKGAYEKICPNGEEIAP